MERYVCIHGHFYQPPRENPWLESVEMQYSAYPYHDWNERITAECYAPNTTSRILDDDNRIINMVNNYTKISFNFGPTLLAWMENTHPDVYRAILEADNESRKLYSGHGSAIAQCYNHMIMPLSNKRDKYTQVIWGIEDFKHRFQREPEGMWLPETAVDLETLDILSEIGIKFTILAPHQAKRMRELGTENWADVNGSIDPTMAYELVLPSGRKIAIFFYDGPVSRAVAFEQLLRNGKDFARRLTGLFSEECKHPQLVNIATDGETYGHHQSYGDMALAYAINYIESNQLAKITNYGEFLEKHPPTHQVEIIENTSWSCSHGVERWWKDCGCNSGSHPGWNQSWRTPLRESMDWLRDDLAPKYEEKARALLKEPWKARDEYIRVILDRSPQNTKRFFSEHTTKSLTQSEIITAFKLLELQRQAMLMYTSCGWFFDELSGIETVQVIDYAGRVVQIAEELFGNSTEENFLERLGAAKSNLPEHGNGRLLYEKWVKPAIVDLQKVAAHYAISSLFEDYGEISKIYCYDIEAQDNQKGDCGKTRIVVGRAKVTSQITNESLIVSFGVLHFGDHNVSAGVREYRGEEAYNDMLNEMINTCSTGDFPATIRLLDKHFNTSTYSLKSLFKDEQQKVLARVLESTLAEVESAYRQVYQNYYPLVRFLTDLGNPLPRSLQSTIEFIINTDLRRAFSSDTLDIELIKKLLNDVKLWDIHLDTGEFGYLLRQTLERKMSELVSKPEDRASISEMLVLVEMAVSLPFYVEKAGVQNLYYHIMRTFYSEYSKKAKDGDETARNWVSKFTELGEKLAIKVA